MNSIEILKIAISSILSHTLRSILTLLSVTIGVASVVVVVSLIQGFNIYVDEKIANIGSKFFTVGRFSLDDVMNARTLEAARRRNKELTLDDFDYLRAHAALVDQVGAKASPTISEIRRNSKVVKFVSVEGATSNVSDIQNLSIADGRYFTSSENETAKRVVFIGADVASQLFPSGTALEQEVSIVGLPYRVIGVAAARGAVFGVPQDMFATIPLKTYAKDFGPLTRRRALYLIANATSDKLFDDAVIEVRQLMRIRRGLDIGEKDNFGIITPDAITGLRDRLFSPIYIVAVTVPSIALVVAGIVIMNTMLVTVTERTREIGLRQAVGARKQDIIKQFLAEAGTLATMGGALGILIAWIVGSIITSTFFPTHLSLRTIIGALTVSGTVGVLSGVLPARKAARLDPVEALRAE